MEKKIFWKIVEPDPSFLKTLNDKDKISDKSRWIFFHFSKILINTKNPLEKWNLIACPDHKDFYLFRMNDDGIGNKRLKVLIQLDFDNRIIRFVGIKEINNPKNP